MSELLTERSAPVVAAQKLTRRAGRNEAGLFLAEGRQAVVEALAEPAGVREVLVTEAAAAAHRDLLAGARGAGGGITPKAGRGRAGAGTPHGAAARVGAAGGGGAPAAPRP